MQRSPTRLYLLIVSAALLLLAPLDYYFRMRPDPAAAAFLSLREGGPAAQQASLAGFHSAVRQEPASPFRWCDLGEAYLDSGDVEKAKYCFSRGLQLGPNTPAIRFRVANFLVRAGELEPALRLMAGLLQHIGSYEQGAYDQPIFSLYDRLALSVPEILGNGMPVDKRAARAWFQSALKSRPLADTAQAWQWMAEHSLSNDNQARAYLQLLMERRQYAAAAQAWPVYLQTRQPRLAGGNLLVDGGFERQPTGAVFDWSVANSEHAIASRDCKSAHSGECSLQLQFDGLENLTYNGLSQKLALNPGQYRFEAFVRTDQISTDEGVRFHIFDSLNPARLNVITSAVTGTTPWAAVRQNVTIPPETYIVVIQIYRAPSSKFENKIKGTVWLDDVSMAPVRV